MKRDKSGWVYVLTNESMAGIVKVGRSFSCAHRRCAEINRSGFHLTPFVVAWSLHVKDCVRVEASAHKRLEPVRLMHNSELFVVSVEMAAQAIIDGNAEKPSGRMFKERLRECAPCISPKSRRLRIPALYDWLKANHDEIHARISGCPVSSSPVYEAVLQEWLSSLPCDYRGRRCEALGVFMEWQRVTREISFVRKAEAVRTRLLEMVE